MLGAHLPLRDCHQMRRQRLYRELYCLEDSSLHAWKSPQALVLLRLFSVLLPVQG